MSLETIELMSDADRQTYADFLARELMKPPIHHAPPAYRPSLSVSGGVWARSVSRRKAK